MGTEAHVELAHMARRAFDVAEQMEWRTYDPYDILLSPFAAAISARSQFGARVGLQVGRRLGWRTRRVLRVPTHEEPKALADFLQASVRLTRAGEEWALAFAEPLAERLIRTASVRPAGLGWGLQFPWVSRFGETPAGEPNIYTTTVVCHALLDAYELSGLTELLDSSIAGGRFILDGLGSLVYDDRLWLRYTETSVSPIVNVQASSASLFIRLFEFSGEQTFSEVADRSAETTVASQRADGSWPYSVDGLAPFVDGFHTGFTLQGLHEYLNRRGDEKAAGVAEAINRGFGYFNDHLLTSDGRPRRFADGKATTDGQTVSQSIQTLVICGDERHVQRAGRIWQLGRAHLPLELASRPLLRWSIGPFTLATAFLLGHRWQRTQASGSSN